MKKSKWYLLSLIIILSIVISLAMGEISFAQENPWDIPIIATGQGEEDGLSEANNASTIFIGMDANAISYPAFPNPPFYSTAYITISDGNSSLYEDIRKLGTGRQAWYLKIEVGSYADPNLPGYHPELSWDPNGQIIDLTDRMELLYDPNLSDPKRADTLAADMITTKTYQTQAEDGTYYLPPPPDMTILNYTIIYEPDFYTVYYQDSDSDNFGDPNKWIRWESGDPNQPSGYVETSADCDDTDPNSYPGDPGSPEICDGKDNNCDGEIPSNETTDDDLDGVVTCADCDDTDPDRYPGAVEICDGKDNDCDGEIDEGINMYYFDNDGDGYGDPNTFINDTGQPLNYVSNHTDCDDANADVYPGRQELPNGIDDNCNGIIDEVPPTISSDPPLSNKVGVEYIYPPRASGYPSISWSFEVSPDTMTIDPNTGKITWIPDPNQVGDHSITLKAENAVGFDSQTWTISVNPAIISNPSPSVKVGEEYSYSPIAIGKGDTNWSLTEFPDGISIDDTSGEIAWVPDEGQIQDHAVTLKVTVNGKDDTQTWTITVRGSSSEQPGDDGGGGCFLSLFLQSLRGYISQLL